MNLKLDGRKCRPKRTNSLVRDGRLRANCEATTPWDLAPTNPTQALRTPLASSSGKVMFSLLCVRGTSTAFRSVYVRSHEGASLGGVHPKAPKSTSWFFARSRGGGGGNGNASSTLDVFSAFVFVALRAGSLSRFATATGRRLLGGFGVPSQWSSCEPRAPPLPKQRPHPFLQASGPDDGSFFGRFGAFAVD